MSLKDQSNNNISTAFILNNHIHLTVSLEDSFTTTFKKSLYNTYDIWTITFAKNKYNINSIITYTGAVEP